MRYTFNNPSSEEKEFEGLPILKYYFYLVLSHSNVQYTQCGMGYIPLKSIAISKLIEFNMSK